MTILTYHRAPSLAMNATPQIYFTGDVTVSKKQNYKLWRWVSKLRLKWRQLQKKAENGDNDTPCDEYLTQERIDRLDSLGFTWFFVKNVVPWEEVIAFFIVISIVPGS